MTEQSNNQTIEANNSGLDYTSTLPIEDSPSERAQEESEGESSSEEKQEEDREPAFRLPSASEGGAPVWAAIPTGFKFPRAQQVLFVRFRSEWTATPWKGDPHIDALTGNPEINKDGEPILYRQCILWAITSGDKKLALTRAQRDPNRAIDELAKQMIRSHDGAAVDWSESRANGIEVFWNEIGEKCRSLLTRMFTQLHVLDTEETRAFLTSCIVARTTGG